MFRIDRRAIRFFREFVRPEPKLCLEMDGQSLEVSPGTTLLEAADQAGIWVPRLCHLPGAPARAVCRLCLVKVKGMAGLISACSEVAREGMIVTTSDAQIDTARRTIMEFVLLDHGCCGRAGCEIEELGERLGASGERFSVAHTDSPILSGSEYIEVDLQHCVSCDRCIRTCYRKVITRWGRGQGVALCFDAGRSLGGASRCTSCGDCVSVCPSGALRKREGSQNVPLR